MPSQASAPARTLESDLVSRLARFFPEATPVRIPVRLSRVKVSANGGGAAGDAGPVPEETVIEFGTSREVLFVVKHPLEFADLVLVESIDGSLRAEASVVAAQYQPERTAIAARFVKPVPNWIVKS